jgi:hypothetical protein
VRKTGEHRFRLHGVMDHGRTTLKFEGVLGEHLDGMLSIPR